MGGVVLSPPTPRSHCPILQVKKPRLSGAKSLAQSDRARWGTEGFHRLHAASQGGAPAGGRASLHWFVSINNGDLSVRDGSPHGQTTSWRGADCSPGVGEGLVHLPRLLGDWQGQCGGSA